jgi:quinohemoprotein ethanol dehydrogenase
VSIEKLIAWDPISQREVWNRPLVGVWNGGVVTTGTGLVFQGTADGKFTAIDADNGKLLWEYNIGSGIIGTPMTFEIDGKQYVTIVAGWGGVLGLWDKFTQKIQPGTVYTFALDSHSDPPVFAEVEPKKLTDLSYTASTKELEHGAILYDQYCGTCHNSIADGEGSIPDLGYSTESTHQSFREIVLNGAYLPAGMPSFSNRLSDKDVKDIQNFVLATAGKKILEMKK